MSEREQKSRELMEQLEKLPPKAQERIGYMIEGALVLAQSRENPSQPVSTRSSTYSTALVCPSSLSWSNEDSRADCRGVSTVSPFEVSPDRSSRVYPMQWTTAETVDN